MSIRFCLGSWNKGWRWIRLRRKTELSSIGDYVPFWSEESKKVGSGRGVRGRIQEDMCKSKRFYGEFHLLDFFTVVTKFTLQAKFLKRKEARVNFHICSEAMNVSGFKEFNVEVKISIKVIHAKNTEYKWGNFDRGSLCSGALVYCLTFRSAKSEQTNKQCRHVFQTTLGPITLKTFGMSSISTN